MSTQLEQLENWMYHEHLLKYGDSSNSKLSFPVIGGKKGSSGFVISSMGDSVGNKVGRYLEQRYVNAYGQRGVILEGDQDFGYNINKRDRNNVTTNSSGSADHTYVWHGKMDNYTHVGGDAATIRYQVNGSPFTCDTMKLYYVKRSGAGTFEVKIDEEASATYPSVSAANATPALGVLDMSGDISLGAHDFRVTSVSGDFEIIGAHFENSTINGPVIANMYLGGINMVDGNAANSTVWNALLQEIDPDLICFEMKDDPADSPAWDSSFATFMSNLNTQIGSSNFDFCYCSTAQTNPATTDQADNVTNNRKAMTLGPNYSNMKFFDQYHYFETKGGWTYISDNSWTGDGTHLDNGAYQDAFNNLLSVSDL